MNIMKKRSGEKPEQTAGFPPFDGLMSATPKKRFPKTGPISVPRCENAGMGMDVKHGAWGACR